MLTEGVSVANGSFEISEFEFQSGCNVHIWNKISRKVMNLLIPSVIG